MTEVWDAVFKKMQMMWGEAPTESALRARDLFLARGVRSVLVPGVGYGRNAKVFVDSGMAVTGIEVSATAIALARDRLGLTFPIHHGSVVDMPFDDRRHDAVFCFGLLYLLGPPQRAGFLRACASQLHRGGTMVFTLIAREAPMYGKGRRLGDDWYELEPGVQLYFYDEAAVRRELGAYGELEISRIDEPMHDGTTRPFLHVVCAAKDPPAPRCA